MCSTRFKLVIVVLLTVIFSGCMVGPNFTPPESPDTNSYTPAPQVYKTVKTPAAGRGGKAQYFIPNRDIPAEWWDLFHSEGLNLLIRTGIRNSPNLAAAVAALKQAQENYIAQVGSTMLPLITGQFSAQRQRFASSTFGVNAGSSVFNLFNASVNVSYTLDVFGGNRRLIEAYCAQVHYQVFQLEAAYLTLTANIATTAITIASLKDQIEATKQIIKLFEKQVFIISQQFKYGGASKADLLIQQTQLEQTKATLPVLELNLSKNQHALSVLIGELPSVNQLPDIKLEDLVLPTYLPISVPSRLVQQRPDIRAAEALLHEASAQIGVAIANLLPQFTLTGNYGYQSTALGTLFSPANKVWNITGLITQTIFAGGSLLAKKRAAVDAYEQAAAQYTQTVLQGFQNVADSLRALEDDAKKLRALKAAEISSAASYKLSERQLKLGAGNYLALIIVQRQYHQSRLERIRAQADRYTDTVALFQALGGGWWNRLDEGVC